MTEEEHKFHNLYWLGMQPMTYNEIAETMNLSIERIKELYSSTKDERIKTSSLRRIWLGKFHHISFGEFLCKFNHADKKCEYCGVTEEQIRQAVEQGVINTKRNRGSILEIDRKDPNGEYTIDNTVVACYWCNNAKTDTFSAEEFKAIGNSIKKIWNLRFEKAGINKIK